MSFQFLAPALLGLSVLVIGPLVAHLTRRRPTNRTPFGAMLLVQRLVKRLRRRQRLRDPLLMATRMLAVLLVVLAVSRPRLEWQGGVPEHGGSGTVVVLVDDSMSMGMVDRGTTLGNRAREAARKLVEELPEGTRIGLIRLGARGERVLPLLTTDGRAVLEAISSLETGNGSTDLAGGLHEARGLLEGEPGEIHVFTDGAGPTVVERAQGELALLLEREITVVPHVLDARSPGNLSVSRVEYGEGLEGGTLTVQVMNHGGLAVEAPCTVGLPGGTEITVFVQLEANASSTEQFTVPPEVPGGVAWARIEDSQLPADNTHFFHLPRVGASRVLVVDGDPGTTPIRSEVYFLERALAPWGSLRGGVLPEVISPPGLVHLDPEVHQVVFLSNLSDPGPYAAGLVDFVRAGGGLVISGGENVTASRYNGSLRDLLPSPLRKTRNLVGLDATGGVPLSLPDVEIPLFSTFTRAGRADLAKMTARRVLTLEPFSESEVVRTLARWEGGIAALVERKVGRGTVLLWTSTLDLEWGSAPLQASFMPLIQQIVGVLGGESRGGGAHQVAQVGEWVEVPLADVEGSALPILTGPEGANLHRMDRKGALRFLPEVPGGWTVAYEGVPPLAQVAVNIAAEESDITPGRELLAIQAELAPELFARRAGLGLPALWLAVVLWCLQALLGRWLARGET